MISLPPPVNGECPVALGYLRTVRALHKYDSPEFSLVYEPWEEPLNELIDIARNTVSSRQLQHQRAFYCVEMMCSRFHLQSQLPRRRSRESLNEVLRALRSACDEYLAADVESSLSDKPIFGLDEQRRDLDRKILHNAELTCEAAELLRQSLKNPDVHLGRVSKRLALVAKESGCYIDRMIAIGKELVEYGEGETRKAWERLET